MENIDDIIKQSLSEEEAKFYDNLDDSSVFENFHGLFKGKNRWLTYYLLFIILILAAFTVYASIKFFNVETTAEMLKWGAGMFASFIAIGFIKIYYWMEMNKNIMLREMKRIELQLSLLSKKN